MFNHQYIKGSLMRTRLLNGSTLHSTAEYTSSNLCSSSFEHVWHVRTAQTRRCLDRCDHRLQTFDILGRLSDYQFNPAAYYIELICYVNYDSSKAVTAWSQTLKNITLEIYFGALQVFAVIGLLVLMRNSDKIFNEQTCSCSIQIMYSYIVSVHEMITKNA